MQVWSPCHEYPLEEDTATQASILAWRIPWPEESGRLQSIGSHRVGHVWRDLAQHPTILLHHNHTHQSIVQPFFPNVENIYVLQVVSFTLQNKITGRNGKLEQWLTEIKLLFHLKGFLAWGEHTWFGFVWYI